MSTAANAITMLPYRRQGEIDYASLEYDPDEPEPLPEAMEQEPIIQEILGIISSRFTDFGLRPDNFLSSNTILCYDPANLNVRVQPDIYLSFGVEQAAIRRRKLYLPWEAGKPPDLALEVASESTSRQDIIAKPGIYAAVGIPEYWRFDPTGGDYHGEPMAGGLLVNGAYQSIELTTEPDGILKGYSPMLALSLAWDEGWPRFYDPATATYLENWRQERAAREAERLARRSAEAERDAERAERLAAETENERLREQIRRLRSEG